MILLLLASILIQLGLSLGKCSHHVVIRLKVRVTSRYGMFTL